MYELQKQNQEQKQDNIQLSLSIKQLEKSIKRERIENEQKVNKLEHEYNELVEKYIRSEKNVWKLKSEQDVKKQVQQGKQDIQYIIDELKCRLIMSSIEYGNLY